MAHPVRTVLGVASHRLYPDAANAAHADPIASRQALTVTSWSECAFPV
jgi:hypothetical protein